MFGTENLDTSQQKASSLSPIKLQYFDALISDRPYRKALSMEEAKKELVKMKGKLDPKIVDVFIGSLEGK